MSAVPVPISNIDPLAAALSEYLEAKRLEDNAKKARVAAEERILALAPAKEEGATTIEVGGFKITTTGKLSYACDDLDALREVTRKWDGNLVPLKTTTTLDDTGCKYLRRERPELWAELARVITIKPAKTAIKVGV